MEFIDMAHTPKNILIKALLKSNKPAPTASYEAYRKAAEMLHLALTLDKSLKAIHKL